MKKIAIFGILSLLTTVSFCQCLQVNIGVIIDTTASPCNGPVTLDAKHPGADFLWSTGETTQKIKVTTTDTFYVQVNKAGCIGFDTITVTFLEPPVIDLGPDPDPVCGGCINLQAGSEEYNYKWSTGATGPEISFCMEGSHKIWVDAFSDAGCKTTDTISVLIQPGIPLDLGPDRKVCGESTILNAPDDLDYLWSTGSTGQTLSVNNSGNYWVEVTDTDGCKGTDTISVELLEIPKVNLGHDPDPICGGCIQLTSNETYTEFRWSTGDTLQSITYCKKGSSDVWLEGVAANGCTNSDTIRVQITEGPEVDLGGDVSQCGGNVELKSNITASEYLWSTGEISQSITVTGTATIWLEVKDEAGCRGIDTINVQIKKLPEVDLGPDPPVKCGGCITLSGNNEDITSYLWSTRENSSSIIYCKEGINKVWLRGTAANGCTATDTILLNILPGYAVNLGNDTTLCGGQLPLQANISGSNYLWSTGHTSNQITVNQSGIYQVSIFNMPGCNPNDTVTGTIQVTFVPELVKPSTITDLSTNCPERVLQVDPVPGADWYQWTVPPGWTITEGQGTDLIKIKTKDSDSQGEVGVIAGNNYGCKSSTTTALVEVPDMELFIPNTFTPNSDGINDTWKIGKLDFYPENELTVINRWGSEVFKTSNYRGNWNGGELNQGAYFYRLKYNQCEDIKEVNGSITILR